MDGIRRAKGEDLPAINEILNECIRNSVNNLAMIERTEEKALEWYRQHGERYPVFVYEENGEIIGWASLSVFRNNEGYLPSVENSVYVKKGTRGRGIGKALLRKLIEAGRELGHHTIVALITEENKISIQLHKKEGFVITGNMIEVGRKFDRQVNVTIMQYFL